MVWNVILILRELKYKSKQQFKKEIKEKIYNKIAKEMRENASSKIRTVVKGVCIWNEVLLNWIIKCKSSKTCPQNKAPHDENP